MWPVDVGDKKIEENGKFNHVLYTLFYIFSYPFSNWIRNLCVTWKLNVSLYTWIYTHRQKLSNSELVLNIEIRTKILEIQVYYLHLTSFEWSISVTEQMYYVTSVKAGIYWREVCFFTVWVWHFVKGSILNRILRSCELLEGNRFVFMENPREGMCQGKDTFSLMSQTFGITYSIMKHVKKRLTNETRSVA